MNRRISAAFLFVTLLMCAASVAAQTTQFTQHGNLGFSASGQYDFQLKLYDTPAVGTGTQQGTTTQTLNVTVTNGDFTLTLDFGATVFTGGELFLETGYRVAGGGAFTVLSPREKITAVYANRSLSAAAADNATQLGGLPSSAYIQNTTSQQAGNFNVAGNGTAGGTLSGNTVAAATQYNLNGSRILTGNVDSTFVGYLAGGSITSGFSNTFVGSQAGRLTSTGYRNSFFGTQAGQVNTFGVANSFFGSAAGFSNTTGNGNAFFGESAGIANTSGFSNSLFGSGAGAALTTGSNNAFFGTAAGSRATSDYNAFFGVASGQATTTGGGNAFLGGGSGYNNTTGQSNTFIGTNAGFTNTTGNSNTLVGSGANVASSNLTNAIAIGVNAQVSQSNALVLGSINGVNGATADTNVGIGTTAPAARLHVSGAGIVRARVNSDANGGLALTINNQPKWSVATTSGSQFQIYNDATGQNAVWITSSNNYVGIGTSSPQDRLHVEGGLLANGYLRLGLIGSGGVSYLCVNNSFQISYCSSSLRSKTNVAPLAAGLNLVDRLQPITFNWKASGEPDLGLGAEDVAKVEPLLVIHNAKGEVEGVKYDRVAVVLLNAVKEQQAQLKEQQQQIEAMKRIICLDHPQADMCEASPRPLKVSEVKP